MSISLLPAAEAIKINKRLEGWAEAALDWMVANNTEAKFFQNSGNHHEPAQIESFPSRLYCQSLNVDNPKFGFFVCDEPAFADRVRGVHMGFSLTNGSDPSPNPPLQYVVGLTASRASFVGEGVTLDIGSRITLIHEFSHFLDATEFDIETRYGHAEALSGSQTYEASTGEIRAKLQEGIFRLKTNPMLRAKYRSLEETDEGRLAHGWANLACTVHDRKLLEDILANCNDVVDLLSSD